MSKGKPFGGKKAAPFSGDGGRDQSYLRTWKGEPRKRFAGAGTSTVGPKLTLPKLPPLELPKLLR